MSTNDHEDGAHEPRESSHDCRLTRFQRNLFFDQKPMFARDFVAEQHFHVDRQDTLARYVAGEGILDGLETSVVEENDGRLTVTVEAGVALDCCGRLLVVPDETTRTLETPGENVTSLYLVYGECVTETVPLGGVEGGCNTKCEYNRVLEVVDIEQDDAAPDFETYKRIPDVDFPDPTTTTLEDPTPLFRMAETFHGNGGTLHDCTSADQRVFLGTFSGDGPGPWSRDDSIPLGYAYSADLLYAALANLLLETNPHRIGLEVEAFTGTTEAETGATLRVQGPENPDGEVTVVTSDPDLTVGNDGSQRITLDVSGLDELRARIDQTENRLDDMEGQLREQSVRYKRTAFSVVFERFVDTAVEDPARTVFQTAVDAVTSDPPRYATPEAFVGFVDDVLPQEQTLEDALPNLATPESITRYATALRDLEAARESGDSLRMAEAQDAVAEAAEWLRPIVDSEDGRVCVTMEDVPDEQRENFPIRVQRIVLDSGDVNPFFTREFVPEGEWKLQIPAESGGLQIRVPPSSQIELFATVNEDTLALFAMDESGQVVDRQQAEGVETHEFVVEGEGIRNLHLRPGSDEQFLVEVCVVR